MTDHDRLFKELLTTYFIDFVDLFLPEIAQDIDRDDIVFLDKEIFTDITSGDKHVADLIAKVRIKGSEVFFIIHVENQSKTDPHISARMFKYFARLHETYGLPIFPVVIFSYDKPMRPEPSHYEVAISGFTVLKFWYKVIQLNRIPWRQFIDKPNPVATALMTRMQIPKEDRPKVKAECLRLLATLKLNPAKSELIGVFIETYLKLSAVEMKVYEREFLGLASEEKESMMEMMTSWHKDGREQGRQEGEREIVMLLGAQRFGEPDDTVKAALDRINTPEQLKQIASRLLAVESWQELLKA